MREIADATILEVRLLAHVKAGEVNGILLRNNVSVPEPAASAATLKEIVEAVPHAAHIGACDGDIGSARLNRICILTGFRHLGIHRKAHCAFRNILTCNLMVVLRKLSPAERKGIISHNTKRQYQRYCQHTYIWQVDFLH